MGKTEAAGKQAAAVPTTPVICDKCKAESEAGQGGFEGIADILDFEPVPRRSQVNSWTAELQRAFIAALAITGLARRAGKAIGRHEHGAEKLRAARGGKSFAAAWDAALDIYRDREMAQLGGQLAGISHASLEQVQKMDLKPGEMDDGAPDMLMTAEGGCLPELVGAGRGRDRGAELMAAMDEIKETGEADGPNATRFFDGAAEHK